MTSKRLPFSGLPWLVLWLLLAAVARGQSGTVMDSFAGMRQGGVPGTNGVPPDISGGVGEEGILQVVNVAAAYFPKTGTPFRGHAWTVPLQGAGSFFPTAGQCFDPRATYDPSVRRFFVIVLEVNNAQKKSYLHLAVSKNHHPNGLPDPNDTAQRRFDPHEWHRYRFEATRTTGSYDAEDPGGADYPTLGVDGRSVYVSANYFVIAEAGANKKFERDLGDSGVFVFDKASLVAGQGAAADGSAPPAAAPRTYFPDTTDGTLQPAMPSEPYSDPSSGWFISLDQDAVDTWIDTFYIGYPGGTGFSTDDDQTAINDLLIPDPAPQPGGAKPLDTLGDRMMAAVRDNVHMIGVFVSEADNEDRSVIRVVRLTPVTGQTIVAWQQTLDAGPGLWNMLPTIAINDAGCLCVSWTACGPNQNPTIYYAMGTGQFGLNPPVKLLESPTPYFGTGRAGQDFARWGDYAAACVDPVDESFWICQQYAYSGGTNSWGSHWAKIMPGAIPTFVEQPYVNTAADATPRRGAMGTPGEVGRPIRTIKVCEGEPVFLNAEVTDRFGQNYQVQGLSGRWLFNGVEVAGSLNRARFGLNAASLSHQGRYQFVVRDNGCGGMHFSEEIYLDVVVPPAAQINQTVLHLGPGASGYFEVTPDAARVAEMDVLTYTWNRAGTDTLLGNRVQAFILHAPEDAAAYDGTYTCTVSNLCGSVVLSGTLIAGPRLAVQPAAPVSPPVCGPAIELTVAGTGVSGNGPPGSTRPDFPGLLASYVWGNGTPGWTTVVWRRNGVPIPLGGRFGTTGIPFFGSSTLTIANPDYEDEGLYDCVVTDEWGAARSVVSAPTRLLLSPLAPPSLTVNDTNGPEYRQGAGMVYDSARGRMVLFGGEAFGYNPRTGSTVRTRFVSNDTWEWDGGTWIRRNPATRPPGLTHFGMAYDARRGRTVVFGGQEYAGPDFNTLAQPSNRVWEWDGIDWQLMASTTASPTARTDPSLCYDSWRQEVLMIGGATFSPVPPSADYVATVNTLWAWSGSEWQPRAALPGPLLLNSTPLHPSAFAFDARRGVAVLFGPFGDSTYPVLEWNGTAWATKVPPLPLRLQLSGRAAAFYDPHREMVGLPVLYDAFASATGADFGKSFLAYWDGNRFLRGEMSVLNDLTTDPPGLTSPVSADGDLSAFDERRRCLVWRDHSGNSFPNSSTSTREMHFSGKVKVIQAPVSVHLGPSGAAELFVAVAGLRAVAWQWWRDGAPLADGPGVSGAQSAKLVLSGDPAALAGAYTLRAQNGHTLVESGPIQVTPAPASLAVSAQGDRLTLTWSGPGVLETAASLTGPWASMPGVVSPYATEADEGRRFFRVRP